MKNWVQAARSQAKRIAFVPTMGNLHAGHCALLRAGRERGDLLVLSIFVNPTQFGPNEDFAKYPRTFKADLEKARSCGVDVIFHPTVEEIYPTAGVKEETVCAWFDTIASTDLCIQLCGASRPGHFRGVATVVAKLFKIVQPHVALFGEKDYQQLQIVRRLVADLDIPVEIVGCPIVRDPDGLAMSSRNNYLSPENRKRALTLSQALKVAADLVASGDHQPDKLCQSVMDKLKIVEARIDYVSLVDAETLVPLSQWNTPSVLAIAAWIDRTRLIDNILFRK